MSSSTWTKNGVWREIEHPLLGGADRCHVADHLEPKSAVLSVDVLKATLEGRIADRPHEHCDLV